jgi:hypothetical protein
MDTSRLTTGELIAGVGGLVLLLSLFLPWYGVSVDIAGVSLSESGNGWEVLGFIDILLLLIAVAAIAIMTARAARALPEDVPAPVLLLALGTLALLLVLYRIIDIPADGEVPPEVDLSRELGIFVALLGAAGATYGGWRANADLRCVRGAHKARRRPEGRAAVGGLELRERDARPRERLG